MPKTIRLALFTLWLSSLLFNFAVEFSPDLLIGVQMKLCLAALYVILWSLVCLTAERPGGRLRTYLIGLFGYYIWVLLNVLFFDTTFGRTDGRIGINLEPFFTIKNYLAAYAHGHFPAYLMIINLLGNLVAFAPFGFFLPALWKKQSHFAYYLPTMAVMIAAVEIIQVFARCGSGDIDDWILNMTGALLMWLVVYPITAWLRAKSEE